MARRGKTAAKSNPSRSDCSSTSNSLSRRPSSGDVKTDLLQALSAIAAQHVNAGSIPLAAALQADLKDVLRRWKQEHASDLQKNDKYVYPLEGRYDAGESSIENVARSSRDPRIDISLEVGNLSGADEAVVRALQSICNELGFAIFLASVERARKTLDEEVLDEAVRLVRVFLLDGGRVAEHVVLSPKNEGSFLLNQYKQKTSSTFWVAGGFFAPPVSARMVELLTVLGKRCEKTPSDSHAAHTLMVVCHEALAHAQKEKESRRGWGSETVEIKEDALAGAIITSSIALDDSSLFREVTSVMTGKLPTETLVRVGEWIGRGGVDFSLICERLQHLLPRKLIIYEWAAAISALEGQGQEEVPAELSAWIELQLLELFGQVPKLYVEDGPALATVLTPRRLKDIVSVMEKFAGTTPALISFLLAIHSKEMPISEETRQAAFKAVFATMLASFDITQDPKDVRMKANEQPYRPRSLDPPPKPPRIPCLDSDSLVQLTMHVIEDDTLRHELSLFTSQFGAQTTRINPLDFESLFLPFLHSLALKTTITEPHHEDLRTLFATTITAYHDRFVGPTPPIPPSEPDVADGSRRWVRPPVRCTCAANCAPLNAFLADARRHRIEFAVGRQRRAHLHQMLDATPRTECTHRTLRGGSPEALVVTKIDWDAVHKRNVRAAWEGRLKSFGGWMEKLVGAGVDLRAVLGLEEYERVVERREEEAPEEGAKDGRAVAAAAGELRKRKASEALVRSSRLQNAEGAGRDVRRRVAETVAVVDLTDD
ncbi:2OG-Fe oxygenase [Lasiodiplodia theobromae]|uniref:2OG-Fe oxygenase n=1 Tax=Lasiodiplodia theobromae TaxID=45133 RepID=UPI0015C2E365|nr:2OG-Fe oxygenase [Lasiodiplodia theobromae]KAF4534138.1 2OG-Fe oxygenase [Lasiodiplodia theobromae]